MLNGLKIMDVINYIVANKGWIFSGVGVSAIGLFVLFYQQRQRRKDKAEERIKSFIDNFKTTYKGGGNKLEALIPAGIANLKTSSEIRKALETLAKILPKHSLRNWKDRAERIGFKKFFDHIAADGRELNSHSIEKYLEHFEKNRRDKSYRT